MGVFLIVVATVVQAEDDPVLDLTSYDGQVVYVDFWASWCGPCRKSFPWLEKMHQKYQSSGLKIIAVNLDQEHALAQEFLASYHNSFSIVYDPEGSVAATYQLVGMPTSLIFGRNGKLLARHVGFKPSDTSMLEAKIRQTLTLDQSIVMEELKK